TDQSYGDWYGGHELGHTYGRSHPGFCPGNSKDDDNYPFPNGMIGNPNDYFGFDVGDAANSIAPQVYDPSVWTDMMTYCPNQWISPYTFMGLLDNLRSTETTARAGPSGPSPPSPSDNLLVSA